MTNRIILSLFCGLFISLFHFVQPDQAYGQVKDIGQSGNWAAGTYIEGGGLVCSMRSEPVKHEEHGKKRGDIFFFVSHYKKPPRVDNLVSMVMGYPLRPARNVEVIIDRKKFKFYTKSSANTSLPYAFANDEDRTKIVAAMKKGNRMVVKGVSKRGTKTKDTYSLKGFTRTYNIAAKACK